MIALYRARSLDILSLPSIEEHYAKLSRVLQADASIRATV